MSKRFAPLVMSCALALGLGVSAPAQATLSISVNAQIMGYSLIDLTPGDGVAPSILFANQALFSPDIELMTFAREYTAQGDELPGEHGGIVDHASDGVPAQVGVDEVFYTVQAQLMGYQGLPGQVFAEASVQSAGYDITGLNPASPYLYGVAYGHANLVALQTFALGAGTAVVFDFAAQLISDLQPGTQGAPSVVLSAQAGATSTADAALTALGKHQRQLVVFNLGAAEVDGQVAMVLRASGYDNTPAVPEAQAVWLALAGAGVVAWRRCRQGRSTGLRFTRRTR